MALAFIHNRPRFFANVMANLLFWLGPDRICYGTDFPIWYPHWQLDDFMAMELPADLAEEYGVQLTDEIKEKIVGGNIARLYGIDIEPSSRPRSRMTSLRNAVRSTWPRNPPTETGVAGTVAR